MTTSFKFRLCAGLVLIGLMATTDARDVFTLVLRTSPMNLIPGFRPTLEAAEQAAGVGK